MAVDLVHHQFTLDQYHAMIEQGILTEDDRVELIAGEIVEMPPTGDSHKGCISFLNHVFAPKLDGEAVVSVQLPVTIPPNSEPEPDLMLLRYRADYYRHSKALPADVLLLVEVAQSSLRYVRLKKLPMYAKGGIAEYWIVDVTGNAIEVYTKPQGDAYVEYRVYRSGESFAPGAFPDLIVSVSDVLGLEG